jgi:hypothetical protein
MVAAYSSSHDPGLPALGLYVLLLPLVFVAGTLLAQMLPRLRGIETPIAWPTRLLVPAYALLLAYTVYAARANLFQGYLVEVDASLAGPIATMQMMLLFQYLAAKAAGLAARRWLGLLMVGSSILLLGMGGRLYVLSSLLALYIYWWKYTAAGPAARRRSLLILLLAPLFFGIVGMWRLGVTDPSELGFYLIAEPLFTAISAFTLMSSHSWALIDVPKDFFSAFLNIVPAVVWPDKGSMIVSLTDTPLQFDSPLGAVSMVVSTIGNFGYIGGLVYIGLVGFILQRVRGASTSPAGRALYCYLCCLLPFMFFRDPFAVQVKVVLTGFLLLWLNRVLALPFQRRPGPAR